MSGASRTLRLASRIKLLTILVVVGLLIIGIGAVQAASWEDYIVRQFWYEGKLVNQIIVPGRPPENYRAPVVQLPQVRPAQNGYPAQQVKILPNSPATTWSYGCSAISAAMTFGYYDNVGYPNMYTGPTNGGVFPLTNAVWGPGPEPGFGECPLSATHQGYDGLEMRGHVDDYWVEFEDPGPDPYLVYGWPEHTHADCTADFMGTSQSEFGLIDGATFFFFNDDGSPNYDYIGDEPNLRDGGHGMRLFAESRGYTVETVFNQNIWGYNGVEEGFTFTDFQREIDAGCPVVIQVAGHSMVGFGYDSTQTPPIVYIHDTWDYEDHEMEWAGSYSDMEHYGVTVIRLKSPPPPTITITAPRKGELITTATPTIIARIVSESANSLVDEAPGVNPGSIVLMLDGTEITDYSYDATTGILTYTPPSPLTPTSHLITLDASDNVGTAAEQAVTNFRVAVPIIDAGLRMFSLPYTYASGQFPTPSQLFGLAAADVELARWWPQDSAYNKHHVYPDPYASLDPPDAMGSTPVVTSPPAGLGYFLRIPTRSTLNITGQAVSEAASYQIRLSYTNDPPQGWNMIGCPFTMPVDWGSVQFITDGVRQSLPEAVADGVTDGILFAFRSTATGGYYDFPADPFAAVMQPFEGYWVHVWKDTIMVIYPPQVEIGATAEEPANRPVVSDDEWQVQIVATAGAYCDLANYIGVTPDGTDGYDAGLDVCKPPPVVDTLRACLPQREWQEHSGSYARDLRGSRADEHSWELEVACSLSNTPVTVQWPRLNATVPRDWQFILEDLDSGKRTFMRTSNGYTFTTGEDGVVRHLRIVGYRHGEQTLTLSGVSAQAAAEGGVVITYALSQPGVVEAEIRNISGALIKKFPEQASSGGKVEMLLWNGRNGRGSQVPVGRYLVRITARNADGQTVQAIRPFMIRP